MGSVRITQFLEIPQHKLLKFFFLRDFLWPIRRASSRRRSTGPYARRLEARRSASRLGEHTGSGVALSAMSFVLGFAGLGEMADGSHGTTPLVGTRCACP